METIIGIILYIPMQVLVMILEIGDMIDNALWPRRDLDRTARLEASYEKILLDLEELRAELNALTVGDYLINPDELDNLEIPDNLEDN